MSAIEAVERTDRTAWNFRLPEAMPQAPVTPEVRSLARRAAGLMDACEQIDSMSASEDRERALAALLDCIRDFEAAPLMEKEAALREASEFCTN